MSQLSSNSIYPISILTSNMLVMRDVTTDVFTDANIIKVSGLISCVCEDAFILHKCLLSFSSERWFQVTSIPRRPHVILSECKSSKIEVWLNKNPLCLLNPMQLFERQGTELNNLILSWTEWRETSKILSELNYVMS